MLAAVILATATAVVAGTVVRTGSAGGARPLARSRTAAATSPLGLDNEAQYPLVDSIPDPVPPGGVIVKYAGAILTPPPADPAITAAQAIADAKQYAGSTLPITAVLANLTIPGTQNDGPVAYIDGKRTYPTVQDLTVWMVIFKSAKPFWPYIGGIGPGNLHSLPPMTAYVIAIDASNGDFVRSMYY